MPFYILEIFSDFFKDLYINLRKRERERVNISRGRGRGRESQAYSMLSTESHAGLNLMTLQS